MKKVLKQIDKSFIDTKNEVRIICDANKYKKKALKIFKRCLKYKIKKQKEDEFKESTEKNLLEKISKLFLFLNGVKEPKFKKEKIGKSFSLNKKQNDSDDNLNIEEAEDTYKFHPNDNTFDSDMVINFKKTLFNDIFSASRKVLENNPNFKQQKNFKILNKEMKKAIKEQIEKYKEGKKIDKPLLDEIGEEILEVSKKIKNKKAEIGDAITKTLTKNEDVKEEKESQQIPKKEEPKQQTKNDEEKVQPPPIIEKTKEPIEEKFPQSNISNDDQPINNQQIPYSFYPHRDTAFHTFLKNRNPGFDLINSEIYNQYPLPNYNYSPINFDENSLRNKTTNINDDLGKFGYRPVLSSLNSSNSRLPEESLINNLNPRLPQNILEKFGYKPTIDFNNHIGLDPEYYSPKNEPEYFKESPIEFFSFVETNHNYNNPPFKENNLSDCYQNNSQMVNLEDKEKERNMKDAINKGSYVIKDRRNEGVIILDKKSLDKINQSNSYTNSPNSKRKEKKVVYLSDIFHIN
ncbi:hypothetical protein TUBRATIS_007020 [Tubulinosema ratisbonensis]|uniref:Uncharacterized protein n=1 Tax=Tubulinosema ratisbonensis TaxID=291195 RepID=A0A437ANN0_9MICR|nr:hypothetical protein TUBRATIS_007020 [Tubulinosema ratisbonensis]